VQSATSSSTGQNVFSSNTKKVIEIKSKQEKFQPEKEFEIVFNSATSKNISEKDYYVNRTRKMRFVDANNFYTLAAETVVACFSIKRSKIDKYYSIYLHLDRARKVVNNDSPKEVEALHKIEKLTDSIVDIFDY